MHVITPWGKWQFIQKTCVFGDGDQRFYQKLCTLPELDLVHYHSRRRQFGKHAEHTVLHSTLYFVKRTPNAAILGYAKLKEKDTIVPAEIAHALWNRLKQHYEPITQ